jgi:hypothetical protein
MPAGDDRIAPTTFADMAASALRAFHDLPCDEALGESKRLSI